MLVPSYHFLEGPLIAVAALGVIVLICRWVFSTDHRAVRPAPRTPGGDYGLLEPITAVRTRDDAEMLRTVLRDAGIRASISETIGCYEVLVFHDDAARARGLVRS